MELKDIKREIQKILEKNNLSMNGESFDMGYSEGVSIGIQSSLYISHMKNFSNALEKLSEADSPIADDGFTGIDIYENIDTETKEFTLDVLYLTDSPKQKELFIDSLVKEGANRNDIDTILDKCIKLSELRFDSIILIDSNYHKELFIEEEARL